MASTKFRRRRGGLEAQVKQVCDDYVSSPIDPKGKPLTPYRIAVAIAASNGDENQPSSGAVSAVLARWVEIGYVTADDRPFAFSAYTAEAYTEGLAALTANQAVFVGDVTQDVRTATNAANWAPFGIAAFAFVPILRAGINSGTRKSVLR